MKHDKGPWILGNKPMAQSFWNGDLVELKGQNLIGLIDVKDETDKANAQLIAAAPEMLDILEQMLERLKDPKIAALWENLEEHSHEMEIYQSVINKAKGIFL